MTSPDEHDATVAIVLQTECVDRSITATATAPSARSSSPMLADAASAWNTALLEEQQHTMYCDVFLEQALRHSHQNTQTFTNPMDHVQHFPQQPLNPCGVDNLFMLQQPQQGTNGADDDDYGAATTHFLSFANCHLVIAPSAKDSSSSSSNHHHHHPQEATVPCAAGDDVDPICNLQFVVPSNATTDDKDEPTEASAAGFDTSSSSSLFLPVTAFPDEFSWTTGAASQDAVVYRLEMDLTEAKALFLLDWQERHANDVTTTTTTTTTAAENGAPDDDSKPIQTEPQTEAFSPSTPQSQPVQPHVLPPVSYERLLHKALQDRNDNSAYYKESMQFMMERELAGLNSVLYVMAGFGVVLTSFLIWTARQIAVENKIKQQRSGDSKTHRLSSKATHNERMGIPASVTVHRVDERQHLSSNGETDSPLSMDPVLLDDGDGDGDGDNNVPGEDNFPRHVDATSPCTNLSLSPISSNNRQKQWWQTQAEKGMVVIADEDSTVEDDAEDDDDKDVDDAGDIQRFLKPAPTVPKHQRADCSNKDGEASDAGDIQRFLKPEPVAPKHEDEDDKGKNAAPPVPDMTPRRIFPVATDTNEETEQAGGVFLTPCTATTDPAANDAAVDDAGAHNPTSRPIKDLKSKVDAKMALLKEPDHATTTPCAPSMAPTHTSSFIEDYW